MSTVKWNEQQRNAIDAYGGTILVSAAAGSGKTAVLSERVVTMLSGENEGHKTDADRLLIVTFSNAAANEMRERIAGKLDERIEKQPQNAALRRQRILLQNADICTIHSFCAKLVRENFHVLGIAPDFRIADDGEMKIMSEEIAQNVTEKYYDTLPEGFARLTVLTAGSKNDAKIAAAVRKLADFVDNDPFPLVRLRKMRDLYASGSELWRQTVTQQAQEECRFALRANARAIDTMNSDAELCSAYGKALSSDSEQLLRLSESCGSYADFTMTCDSFSKGRKNGRAKGYDPRLAGRIDALRDASWDAVKRAKSCLCCSEEEADRDLEYMAPAIKCLCDMTADYIKELTKEKQRRNVLHFGDLEHRAVELLVGTDDKGFYRTDIAADVSARYDEILLDEYQDTSAVQDMIFRAIAKEDGDRIVDGEENLFMVGDIKQSIYRFRSAVSALFSGRYERYCDYDADKKEFPARILLAKNYRSRPEVTDTINYIFRRLMTKKSADVDYMTQQLEAAADYPAASGMESELHILANVEQEEGGNAHFTEAQFIARKIRQMLDDGFQVTDKETKTLRKARPGDFCILRRSVKGEYGQSIASELAKVGIGSLLSAEAGFLDRPEIITAMSMLRVIDNPLQEVALLTVLTSPMFGFTASELAQIRLCLPEGNLYSALTKCAQEGNEKCAGVIAVLTRFRALAAMWPGDRLISTMLRETGYMSAVLKLTSGLSRQANLKMLIKYAEKYESTGYHGISGFIRFIDNIEAQDGGDLDPAAPAAESSDAVRVMTIHKSKGLEFPVCIVCGLGNPGRNDEKWLSMENELGIGMYNIAPGGSTKYETVQQKAIEVRETAAEIGENIRLLYVALTRAKEKLIMTGTCSTPADTVASAATLIGDSGLDNIPGPKKKAFLEWVTACLMTHPSAQVLRELSGTEEAENDSAFPMLIEVHDTEEMEALRDEEKQEREEEQQAVPDGDIIELLRKRLEWKCPSQGSRGIPSKVTASSLHANSEKNIAASSLPAFMSDSGLTAVQRGSALHKFMEKADCAAAVSDIDGEIARLAASGVMNEKEIKVLDRQKLADFFGGEGGKMMMEADEILRERNFSAVLPKKYHHLFTDADTDETIIIEGACDCVLVYPDHAVIIDYKSDRMFERSSFAEDYGDQLRLYAAAMEQVLEKKVTRTAIWSFNLSCFIDIK